MEPVGSKRKPHVSSKRRNNPRESSHNGDRTTSQIFFRRNPRATLRQNNRAATKNNAFLIVGWTFNVRQANGIKVARGDAPSELSSSLSLARARSQVRSMRFRARCYLRSARSSQGHRLMGGGHRSVWSVFGKAHGRSDYRKSLRSSEKPSGARRTFAAAAETFPAAAAPTATRPSARGASCLSSSGVPGEDGRRFGDARTSARRSGERSEGSRIPEVSRWRTRSIDPEKVDSPTATMVDEGGGRGHAEGDGDRQRFRAWSRAREQPSRARVTLFSSARNPPLPPNLPEPTIVPR